MTVAQSQWWTHPPAGQLRPYIDSYIGYRLTGYAPGLHRGLPSRNMTFIVSVGPPIDVVAQTDPSQSPDRYRAIVSGLHASPALIGHDGHQEGVSAVLSPLGARTMLGMPARELWNTSAELADVVGVAGEELWERVQRSKTWDQRFAAMDTVLASLVRDTETAAPEVSYAWERMVGSAGKESVAALAESIGWSRQHLRRRFLSEFGLSPKLASRVFRFNRAARMIGADPTVALADVAFDCGYFDQSHMTNEFVELAGCTPGRLMEGENVPKFQDDTEGAG